MRLERPCLALGPWIVALALNACGTTPNATPPDAGTGSPDASAPMLGLVMPQTLHDELAIKDFLLVDVHTPYAGEVPGTDAHIAFTSIDALVAFVGSDLDRKAVLTCLSGSMSLEAGQRLVDLGYRRIRSLDGGMNGWVAAGYTLTHTGP